MINDLSRRDRQFMEEPKISVLVPVYNTEKLVPRCLDSILRQTYKNLEVIVVSDCSPGNITEIIQPYLEADPRVRFIEHEKNQGVFAARMTAFHQAKGDYIACVDSDDYLGVDFYRRLMRKAQQTGADMVCGNLVVVDEINKRKSISFLNRPTGESLRGSQIMEAFMEKSRYAFHWVVLWNKLYRRELWDKAKENLHIDRHFLNYEDVFHTMLLHYYAKHYESIDYEGYFYIKNVYSTTSIAGDKNKFIKLIDDLVFSFSLMENFLKKVGLYEQYGAHLTFWKEREVYSYDQKIKGTLLSPNVKKKLSSYLKDSFSMTSLKPAEVTDNYFYLYERDWSSRLEDLLESIAFSNRELLVIRASQCLVGNLCVQDDLLLLCLGTELEDTDFPTMRAWAGRVIQAEGLGHASEKVRPLDRVYDLLEASGKYSDTSLQDMKQKEIASFAKRVYLHQELLDCMQVHLSKNQGVIIVNDTLHEGSLVEEALAKNWEKEKFDPARMKVLDLEALGSLEPNQVLEIVAEEEAKGAGLQEGKLFYPKRHKHMTEAMAYLGCLSKSHSEWQSRDCANHYELLLRLLGSLLQKRYYSTLLNESCLDSDFLLKPVLYGYYPVGFYLVGACLWLHKRIVHHGIQKLVVDANLFDSISLVYKTIFGESPTCELLCSDRSRLDMLRAVCKKPDLRLPLYVDLRQLSWKRLLDIFDLPDEVRKKIEQTISISDELFHDEKEYYDLLPNIRAACEDLSYHETMRKEEIFSGEKTAYLSYGHLPLEKDYFREFFPEVQQFVLHAKNHSETVEYFEDRNVIWSSSIEEFFLNPSLARLATDQGASLREINTAVINKYLVTEMRRGLLQLAQDFKLVYGEYATCLGDRAYGVDRGLQRLLFSDVEMDKRLFKHMETKVDGERVSIFQIWKRSLAEQEYMHNGTSKNVESSMEVGVEPEFLYGRRTLSKALFYLLYNRGEFKRRFKVKFASHPQFVQFCRKSYGILRKIKHKA
ncbi:glycosyltransferase family 2 protein [Clostridia bacterium]|nr:glycosyltransferase family 2 protein [Clostridia bacterium]